MNDESKIRKSAYNKKWKQDHKEQYRIGNENTRLQRVYGITLEQYEAMYKEQNGLCAICQKPERHVVIKGGRIRRLAVDHDHSTNQVRQLLCTSCNHGIGLFEEDILRLLSAIEYLKKHTGKK